MDWMIFILITVIVCVAVLLFPKRDARFKTAVIVCIIFIAAFGMLTWHYSRLEDMYRKAMFKPTMDDVPEKAHIVDTMTMTIHGSDTVYNYRIEWND